MPMTLVYIYANLVYQSCNLGLPSYTYVQTMVNITFQYAFSSTLREMQYLFNENTIMAKTLS